MLFLFSTNLSNPSTGGGISSGMRRSNSLGTSYFTQGWDGSSSSSTAGVLYIRMRCSSTAGGFYTGMIWHLLLLYCTSALEYYNILHCILQWWTKILTEMRVRCSLTLQTSFHRIMVSSVKKFRNKIFCYINYWIGLNSLWFACWKSSFPSHWFWTFALTIKWQTSYTFSWNLYSRGFWSHFLRLYRR